MNDYVVLINNFEEMLKQNMNLVDVIGDCPNIERPIAPDEYSCAMKSHFRKSGNQMSGKWKSSYASLLA